VLVAVQLSVPGLYLPPVLTLLPPPQTIISVPVHTAVCACRPLGALVVLVAAQLSMLGSYLPPVLTLPPPPQTIISVPVHSAVCSSLPVGALVVLVALQLSVLGLYLPPVFATFVQPKPRAVHPPQMIISLSDHTAV
jgi:hypothetical protein